MAFAKLHHRQNSKGERIYYVEYRLPGRKNTKFTIGNVEARKAKEIADNIRALIIQGIDPHEYARGQAKYSKEKPRLKLSEAYEKYLQHCAIVNRPKTIQMKRYAYTLLLKNVGNCYFDSITKEMIEKWMVSSELSKVSINMYFRSIRSLFYWAYKENIIDLNLFKDSNLRQFKIAEANQENYFTAEEIDNILKAVFQKDNELGRLVFIALETGGRISELLSLQISDIDIVNNKILFQGINTKSGKNRFVPVRPAAINEISKWTDYQDGRLFRWKDHKKPSRLFTKIIKELEFDEIPNGKRTFHTLRHTYASHLLMKGFNIFLVSRWLGHSSVAVTEKHYGHLIPNMCSIELPWLPTCTYLN